jgi:hypothetical protein
MAADTYRTHGQSADAIFVFTLLFTLALLSFARFGIKSLTAVAVVGTGLWLYSKTIDGYVCYPGGSDDARMIRPPRAARLRAPDRVGGTK